ncbi:putative ferredoxin-thioredoxin reductase, variable chain [Synechococcus sp. RS9917]|nr:putative ferredoxin-thioredoxin reductase, variable chain [Synechococcus sp. RS9917]
MRPSDNGPMQAGDKVTVSTSVVVYNHPQHRGEGFDLQGQEGEVVSLLGEWKGRPISPTLPVVVAFGRYKAHFREDELTALN